MNQGSLLINEIFFSIQGESTWSGLPCVFVRLKGCPHRCHYCDTSYAFSEGTQKSIEEVMEEITSFDVSTIEITGGEPLIQQSVHLLIQELCDQGKTVLIETCGSRDISTCDSRSIRIIDIKTPDSGASDSFLPSNFDSLRETDEIKFVITSHEDFKWACRVTQERDLFNRVRAVHVSPVMEQEQNQWIEGADGLDPQTLATWLLESGLPFRFHLQMHKYIWPRQLRGV